MKDDQSTGGVAERNVLQALPLGFCLFDPSQTLVQLNDVFARTLSLAPDALSRGMSLADTMRILAYNGVFGPGDPERQATDAARIEPDRPRRLRRARPDGGAHELTLTVLPDGFFLATVVEVSTLLRQRDAADERQHRLAATFEALPQGIARFDEARALLFSNRRFAALLGLPDDALRPGLAFAELERTLRDDADVEGFDAIAAPAQALATQFAVAAQFGTAAPRRCSRRDGSLIDIAATRLSEGGWAVTATDVSPDAAAEDAARRRGKLLGAVIERLPQGLCLFGANRRIDLFNRAFAQLIPEAAARIGDGWDAFATRLVAASTQPAGSPGPRLDPREPQGWRHLRPDGSTVDLRMIPLPNGGTACVATSGSTDDTGADARLADMEAMLSTIRHGIVLWTRDRNLVASSRIAADLLGLPETILRRGHRQQDILEAMAEGDRFGPPDQAAPLLMPLLTHDAGEKFSGQLTDIAGRRIEIRSDPVPNDGFIWTCTDVTDRYHFEEELRRAREAAEAVSLAKSSFLATMSHELRTPLNAVIGFSETLSRESNDRVEPGRIAEFANAINDAGRHLLGLVNNILDVARIEAGRFDLASDRIDLAHLVATCMRQASTSARAAEVSLHADIPKDLPPLRGDERRLRQVLAHLINNAIKFTDSGGSVRIDASLRDSGTALGGDGDAGGDLLISVADTGIGIPEADLQRVFEPFTQIDNGLARRAGGSGLGLYFSRALITAHGGDLMLASRPGKGTTAVIRLPRSRLIESGTASQAGLQERR